MKIGREDVASLGKCAALGPMSLAPLMLGKVAVTLHPVVAVSLNSARYTQYSTVRRRFAGEW